MDVRTVLTERSLPRCHRNNASISSGPGDTANLIGVCWLTSKFSYDKADDDQIVVAPF